MKIIVFYCFEHLPLLDLHAIKTNLKKSIARIIIVFYERNHLIRSRRRDNTSKAGEAVRTGLALSDSLSGNAEGFVLQLCNHGKVLQFVQDAIWPRKKKKIISVRITCAFTGKKKKTSFIFTYNNSSSPEKFRTFEASF